MNREPGADDRFLLALWEDPEDERDARTWDYFKTITAAEDAAMHHLRGAAFNYAAIYEWNRDTDDYDIERRVIEMDDLP